MKRIITLFAVWLSLLSCSSYYKMLTVQNPGAADCKRALDMNNRYYVFHTGSTAFAMKNISFINDNTMLRYRLTELPAEHKLHLNNSKTKKFRYNKGNGEYDRSAVLNEIHFYTDSNTSAINGVNEIAVGRLMRMEIIENDRKKNSTQRAIGWGVAAAATVAGVALIIGSSLTFDIK